jgi:NTP pyrophosphatase (non-canonical NTP hydrolase)
MTINEYQKLAQRTSPDDHNKLLNGCMGLAGECGEVCDVMKKALFQGHALDRAHMIEELGDCAWYLAEAAFRAWRIAGRYPAAKHRQTKAAVSGWL